MPKVFSEEEKLAHKTTLLEQGLSMIMERGYKNVTVDQLIGLIHASKGYFYLMFESKEAFFLQAIMWQMERHLEELSQARENGAGPEELSHLYRRLFFCANFTNYEDLLYIGDKVSAEQWAQFRSFEEQHYQKVVRLFGKDPAVCDPKVMSNLSAMIYLSYGMDSKALCLFPETHKEVLNIMLDSMHRYVMEH